MVFRCISVLLHIVIVNGFTFSCKGRQHYSAFQAALKADTRISMSQATWNSNERALLPIVPSETVVSVQIKEPFNFQQFWKTYWLVFGEVFVIILAKINPTIGCTGGMFKPEVTISKCAIFVIFFINGLLMSLNSAPEQRKSATKFNMLIQAFAFLFIPIMAKILTPLYPHKALIDGLLVLSCLPPTLSICISQTQAADGDMTAAIFNAIFANAIGVFVTPLLTVWAIGTKSGGSLLATLLKLGNIVILPMILGQLLRLTPVLEYAEKFRVYSKQMSSFLLLSIVYNTFSDTFITGFGISGPALISLFYTMPLTYLSLSFLFWHISKMLLPGLDTATRTAGLFAAPQKTLAFGIPFIKTALGHRADLPSLLAPLLIYAPVQLILGSSIIVPMMKARIEKEQLDADGSGI